ncbi:DUF3086 domain-containing protein [Pseudanabaena cinerea]|nr:DUF3086 domain-containing protein [Pseudanabaena cinerea]
MNSDQLPVEENLGKIDDAQNFELNTDLSMEASPDQQNIKQDIQQDPHQNSYQDQQQQQQQQQVQIGQQDVERSHDQVNELDPALVIIADDPQSAPNSLADDEAAAQAAIAQLKQQESQLQLELEQLKTTKTKILQDQLDDLQAGIIRLAQADVARLEYQKNELQAAIAVLEKRKERLDKEMTSTYAGISQDIAVRVQGFKEYLVGSLQDLVASAEKLNLVPPEPQPVAVTAEKSPAPANEPLQLSAQTFAEYKQRVDQLLERYRTLPDYYGPAWKLRRTFEQVHSDRVAKWFFEQSGRGAIRTMGTRLQNILVTSAAISVLKAIYGEKLRILVLATSPERLGEWRRGFQDCLGLTREHFGSEKGIALFEDPEPLATKGDRLVKEELMPLVVIDESEELIAVDLLRFPLLIAFGGIPEARPAPTASSFTNRDFSRDTARDMGRDPSRDFNRDFSREPYRDPSRDFNRDSSREPYRDPNRDYNRDRDSRNRGVPRDYSDRGSDRGYDNRNNNPDSDWDW